MVMLPQDVRDRVTGYIQHQGTKSREAIIDLVRTSQQRYIDIVSALDDAAAAKKPSPEEWSVRELLRHVISAERGVTELVHYLARGEDAPPSATEERGLGMMLPEDARSLAEMISQLSTINEGMLQAIRDMPAAPDLEKKAPHPFFGPLNCAEWAVFQRVHDEDHVQHALKILSATA